MPRASPWRTPSMRDTAHLARSPFGARAARKARASSALMARGARTGEGGALTRRATLRGAAPSRSAAASAARRTRWTLAAVDVEAPAAATRAWTARTSAAVRRSRRREPIAGMMCRSTLVR